MGFLKDLARGKGMLGFVNPVGAMNDKLLGGLGGGPQGGGTETAPAMDPRYAEYVYGGGGHVGALKASENLYRQGGKDYYPGNTVAGFTGAEIEGQRALTSYASQGLPQLITAAQQGATDLMGGGAGPSGPLSGTVQELMAGGGNPMLTQAGSGQLSPYYQDVLSGAYNDMGRNYTNTIGDIFSDFETGVSAADDAALLSGNFGGSRGGVARGIVGKEAARAGGLAQQALSENMAQGTADVMNTQFSDARTAQLAAGLGLLDSRLNATRVGADLHNIDVQGRIAGVNAMPSIAEMGMLPGTIYGGVGAQQRDMNQTKINAAIDKFNFEQDSPYNNLEQYINNVRGFGPYTQQHVNFGEQEGPYSNLAGAIGGGLSGAATGFKLGGPKGALVGGGVGALGGYFG